MTLRRMKTLYCVAVMAIGILLAASGMIGWITAVILLSSALPSWKAATHAAAKSALIGFRGDLAHANIRHTEATRQASEDRRAARR
jgi:hypothetical protein